MRRSHPRTRLRASRRLALALAAALLVAASGPARATPPSPPLELELAPGAFDAARGALSFSVRARPLVAADSLIVEVHSAAPPLGRDTRAHAALRAHAEVRDGFAVRTPSAGTRHVYVRAVLYSHDGARFTRGADLALGPHGLADAPPAGRVASDGAGGSLRVFDGRALAGASWRAASAPASTWTASGTFLYRDRTQDASGFTGAEPDLPARLVDVQVLDATTAAVLATGATDTLGHFAIVVSDAAVRTVKVRAVTLSSHTAGLLIDVRDDATQRQAYGVDGATVAGHDPATNVDFGTATALPGTGGEGFNIFDVLLNGARFFQRLEGAYPTLRVTAYWQPTSSDGTFYQSGDNSLRLRGAKGYDDTVIGHEQGHFFAHNWSKDDTPGGAHYLGDNAQDLRLAWSEGFATWWAGAVRRGMSVGPRPDLYIDTDGAPGAGNLDFAFGFETPTLPAHGAANEIAVSAVLWDIVDDAATPDATPGADDDALARPASDPWEVIRNALPYASNVSLEDFWDGWFRAGHDHGGAAAMQAAFAGAEVSFAADAAEPDSAPAQAAAIVADGRPYDRTAFPAADVDQFALPTAAGHAYVAETTNLLSGANTALSVFAPDGVTVVGTNDDRAPGDPSSRVAFVSAAGGTYRARVTRPAGVGAYGQYAFRVTDGAGTAGAWSDQAAAKGVARTGTGRGVAWGDFDGDSAPDLFVTGLGATTALYRNQGGSFTNVAATWGAAVTGDATGVALCDFDGDGDLDAFVTRTGATVLLQNRRVETGTTSFTDVTTAAGVLRTLDGRSAAWADADRDGRPDLFVCAGAGQSLLFRNLGGGTFADVTAAAGVTVAGTAVQAAWCDYDRDGDDDLYVVVEGGPSHLFRNRLRETGSLSFVDVAAGAGVPGGLASTGAAFGDFDGDGWMDLYVTVAGGPNFLYRNQGNGTFADVAKLRGTNPDQNSACAAWADVDDDGDLDLFVGNDAFAGYAGANLLYESIGGSFVQSTALAAGLPTRAAAWADFDGDGDPDLYLSCDPGAANQLLVNPLAAHHALAVSLLGRTSNRDGLGATVRAVAGGVRRWRYVSGCEGPGSQGRVPLLFGLGAVATAESLVVDWPSGKRSVLLGVPQGAVTVDEAGAVGVGAAVAPWRIALSAPAPQPAQGGRASLAFVVPGGAGARVSLALYDVAGRRVRTLVDGALPAGPARVALDGADDRGGRLAAGVYLVELRAGGQRAVTKLVALP